MKQVHANGYPISPVAALWVAKGFTNREMAEALGISFDHITKISGGHRGVGADLLLRMSELLKIKPRVILDTINRVKITP